MYVIIAGGGKVGSNIARSLIEMQGGTLSLGAGLAAEGWTARIVLPAGAGTRKPRHMAATL